jgi:hypothetical protein
MNHQPTIRILLIIIAVTIGLIAALVAGIVAHVGGGSLTSSIRSGGVTFATTVTVVVLLFTFVLP